MATLKHIAYNLADIQGRANDPAFVEQTKFQVEYTRSLLFRRDFERNAVIPIQMLQTIRGIEVVEVDAAELDMLDIGCVVYRTERKIPAPMNLKGINAFKFVGTVDMQRSYSFIDSMALEYVQFNRYNQRPLAYFYRDGYLYLTTNPKRISVTYLLDEPSKLEEFVSPEGVPVFTEDSEYPITMELIQRVTQTILGTEARSNQQEDDHEVNVAE